MYIYHIFHRFAPFLVYSLGQIIFPWTNFCIYKRLKLSDQAFKSVIPDVGRPAGRPPSIRRILLCEIASGNVSDVWSCAYFVEFRAYNAGPKIVPASFNYGIITLWKKERSIKELKISRKLKHSLCIYIYILSAISFTLTISFLLTITLPILIVGAALVKFSI